MAHQGFTNKSKCLTIVKLVGGHYYIRDWDLSSKGFVAKAHLHVSPISHQACRFTK